MIEVRFHSIKGGGALEAARILAAALRIAGRDSSWFVPVGWEGSVNFEAVMSRGDETDDSSRHSVLGVFYPPLLEVPDVWMQFEEPQLVLVNTRDPVSALYMVGGRRIAAVDASGIARKVGPCYGVSSLTAPMLGALAAASNFVLGVHLIEALKKTAHALSLCRKDYQKLVDGLEAGYDKVCIRGGNSHRDREYEPAIVGCGSDVRVI